MMGTLLSSRPACFLRAAACLVLALAGAALGRAQTPQPVIVADFNDDGIPDALVVSTTSPTATIALGSVPYGSFSPSPKAVTFPSACTSFPQGSLLVGDFNNDGLADIAFFCGSSGGVLLGNGDGTFGAPKPITAGATQLAVLGDFNKDGKLDIAAIGIGGDNIVTNNIQFLAGNGDGTFAVAKVSPLSQQGFSTPVVADIDGDGYPDIVLLVLASNFQMSASVNVFGNNKDGTFGVAQQGYYDASAGANFFNDPVAAAPSILAGNFFGNNVNDLIVPDTGTYPGLYLIQNNSTSGNFSLGDASKTVIAGLTAAAAGFFGASGATDLVIANGTAISVLDNDGSGNFATDYRALTIPSTTSLFAVADANGDGYTDVYSAASDSGALSIAVNITTGSATATSQRFSLNRGTQPISATWNGNANLLASTASGQQIVNGAITVTNISSSENPSEAGDSVTLTVAIPPSLLGGPVPSGNVVLTDGTTTLANGTLTDGSYSYTTSTFSVGTHAITVAYAGDNYYAPLTSAVLSQVVHHAPAVATNLSWATPSPIVYGTPLSTAQLDATALDASGNAIPGTFAYTPAPGTVLDAGTKALSVTFTPTDSLSFLATTKTVTLTVTQAAPVLTWATPASTAFGVPLTATQLNAAAAGVTGAALPGTFTYTPAAGTVLNAGTQTLSVSFVPTNALDYTDATASVSLVVTASVSATVTAPPTTPPGSQTTIAVALAKTYPVDLNVTLNLAFASSTTPQITNNQQLQLACQDVASNCTLNATNTTLTFTVPANTTTVPVILLQAGTIAGTITVPVMLTAGGSNVTPPTLLPAVIQVPAAVPTVSGMTLTRTGSQLTIVIHGFSNTREVVNAKFHFTAASGAALGTTDLTLPADTIFNADWFDTTPSEAYGSTFTYTQIFNTSEDASSIGSVDATLTNSIGVSTSITAK